jgi:hypothetical protein
MLWTIFVILLILWLLGFSFHIAGGLIHILLVIAVVVLVINLISGRRTARPLRWLSDRHQLTHKPTCNEEGSVR